MINSPIWINVIVYAVGVSLLPAAISVKPY
nr:MAG TPA: hypothetical protein [Caudoviricetes sp.]